MKGLEQVAPIFRLCLKSSTGTAVLLNCNVRKGAIGKWSKAMVDLEGLRNGAREHKG